MKTTHTPGPWQRLGFTIDAPSEHRTICHLAGGPSESANARLITAAPEMRAELERAARALSTIASYVARDTDTGVADAMESQANDIRALLARIDGDEDKGVDRG